MNRFGQWRPVVELVLLSIAAAAIHYFVLKVIRTDTSYFVHRPLNLYLYFGSASAIILFVLILLNRKKHDNVGFGFMFLTFLKMGFAYVLLRPILGLPENKIEKINFFIIFAVFLVFETLVAGRMLNRGNGK